MHGLVAAGGSANHGGFDGCRGSEQVSVGIWCDVHVVVDVVFADSADFHLALVIIIVPEGDFISHGEIVVACQLLTDDRLTFARIGNGFAGVVVEIHELPEALGFRRNQDDGFYLIAVEDVGTVFMDKENILVGAVVILAECFLLFGGHVFIERHIVIVFLDFVELEIHHILDGIPNAQTGHQKGGTAADADEHHEKTFFVAEDIPEGDFLKEAEPVPQKSNSFQKNSFSVLRCPRPNQLCRDFSEIPQTRKQSGTDGAKQGNPHRRSGQLRAEYVFKVGIEVVHHAVGFPDHLRENISAGEKSGNGAQ